MTLTSSTFPSAFSRSGDFPSREERSRRTAELLARRAAADSVGEEREITAEIVEVNRAVAIALARRYKGRGVAFEDLCQTAFEGLTKAVVRFDSDRSEDLLTFAVPTIRGELLRHFRDHAWTVRPPRRVQELRQQVSGITEELRGRLGHEPTCAEVADHLGVDEDAVLEAKRAGDCFQPLSLAQPTGGSAQLTLADVLCDEDDWNDLSDAKVSLIPAVRRLSERDRRILYLRFFEDLTQAEIGAELGISQMQVSRLLLSVLGRLRAEIA